MNRDPICGMTVNPDTALNAEREGQTHYFCSEECREQFLSASVVARRTDPCVIVIFGASGDLTSRKLLPSLRNLVASGLLTDDFAIIGVGRTEWSDQDFREQMRSAVAEFAPQKVDPALWENIEERMRYCSGSYSEPETYHRLNTLLSEADASHRTGGNALFYLSVPYTTFGPIAEQLNASGLLNEEPYAWRTIASVWRGWICLHFCRIKPNPKYHRASMPRCLDASMPQAASVNRTTTMPIKLIISTRIQGLFPKAVYNLQPADLKWWDQHTTNINMKSKLTLAISLLSFAYATPALVAEEPHQGATTKEAHADHMLEGYSAVATALYKDDLAAAKNAAVGMVKHDKDSAMAKHCQAIADSKTIEEARTHFKMLSDAAIPVAKKEKMMHEMHCPMAFGNKGANWLQKSADEVQNPYFGAKMPHCGEMVMAK